MKRLSSTTRMRGGRAAVSARPTTSRDTVPTMTPSASTTAICASLVARKSARASETVAFSGSTRMALLITWRTSRLRRLAGSWRRASAPAPGAVPAKSERATSPTGLPLVVQHWRCGKVALDEQLPHPVRPHGIAHVKRHPRHHPRDWPSDRPSLRRIAFHGGGRPFQGSCQRGFPQGREESQAIVAPVVSQRPRRVTPSYSLWDLTGA